MAVNVTVMVTNTVAVMSGKKKNKLIFSASLRKSA